MKKKTVENKDDHGTVLSLLFVLETPMSSPPSFDKMDEHRNSATDVVIPPMSMTLYEENDSFVLIPLRFGADMTPADSEAMIANFDIKFLKLPKALCQEPFFTPSPEDPLTGFRVCQNDVNWNKWMEHEKPIEGDWLMCGHGDATRSAIRCPMDETSFGHVFYAPTIANRRFYIARSVNKTTLPFIQHMTRTRHEYVEITEKVSEYKAPRMVVKIKKTSNGKGPTHKKRKYGNV